ncbi:MAG: hypothetical protein K2M65_04855, partial [Muribaculaceae bacterium]|nr:hypothetical protein [Muribaculaceae bacterium]
LLMRKYSENLTNTHSTRSIINNIHHLPLTAQSRNYHAKAPECPLLLAVKTFPNLSYHQTYADLQLLIPNEE